MTNARAAVLLSKDKVEIWDVKVHDPLPGGALVEVCLGGVCGTDVHMFRGLGSDGYPLPIILGHEGVGRLSKLGSGISTDFASQPVKPGDLVYWSPKKACGRCYACNVLDDSPCEHSIFCGPALEPNWSTHQEFACLPPGMPFFKVPEGASLDAVISLGCALPTALRGLDLSGPIRIGETVVVQGAGPVGLAAVLVAKTAGAREIIVIDQHLNRLERARSLGATATITLDQSPEERKRAVLELCGRQGPNVVVEATGFMPAFPEGVDLTGMHGRYCVVGLFGAIGTSAIPPRSLALKNLRIQGAMSPKPKHYYQALHLAARMAKELPLADLVTHRFALKQEVQALESVETGAVIKAVIDLGKN